MSNSPFTHAAGLHCATCGHAVSALVDGLCTACHRRRRRLGDIEFLELWGAPTSLRVLGLGQEDFRERGRKRGRRAGRRHRRESSESTMPTQSPAQ